jgi:hypothetical protein
MAESRKHAEGECDTLRNLRSHGLGFPLWRTVGPHCRHGHVARLAASSAAQCRFAIRPLHTDGDSGVGSPPLASPGRAGQREASETGSHGTRLKRKHLEIWMAQTARRTPRVWQSLQDGIDEGAEPNPHLPQGNSASVSPSRYEFIPKRISSISERHCAGWEARRGGC